LLFFSFWELSLILNPTRMCQHIQKSIIDTYGIIRNLKLKMIKISICIDKEGDIMQEMEYKESSSPLVIGKI